MTYIAKHSQAKKFYVYQYKREYQSDSGSIGSPYYIGKGTGNRVFQKRHRVPSPKNSSYIEISENMNEADAFQLEMLLIHLFGRIDNHTGCLRNWSDGGEKPPHGINATSFKKGQQSPRLGVILSEATKQKQRNYWTDDKRKELSEKLTGKKRTASQKQKMSNDRKGKHSSPSTEFKKGLVPWNKGKPSSLPLHECIVCHRKMNKGLLTIHQKSCKLST